MASVFIDNYHVYYSIKTGEIKEFEESNFTPVIDNYDKKLEYVVTRIMKSERFLASGYPAFVKAYLEKHPEVKAKS